MSREIHVRFREGVRVRVPRATRPDLLAYLIENTAILVESQRRIGLPNLRTVGYAADCFRWIFNERSEPSLGKSLSGLLLTVATLSNELASGRIGPTSQKKLEELYKTDWNYVGIGSIIAASGTTKKPKSYAERFADRYGLKNVKSLILVSIVGQLVVFGEFNKAAAVSALDQLARAEVPVQVKKLDELANFRPLEEAKLESLVAEVLEFVKNGAYELSRYPYIYSLLLYIRDHGYYSGVPNDLHVLMASGIDKANIGGLSIPMIEMDLVSYRYDQTRQPDEHFGELVRQIKEKTMNEIESRQKSSILTFLENLGVISDKDFLENWEKLPRDHLFNRFTSKALSRLLIGLNNLGIYRLEMVLRDRITSIGNAGAYYIDEDTILEEAAEQIEGLLPSTNVDQMRKARLRDLSDALKGAAQHLRKTRNAQ